MTNEDLREVITYLKNYSSDLGFQLAEGGADYINQCTDETPEFQGDEQAEEYITKLDSLITELKATYASYF